MFYYQAFERSFLTSFFSFSLIIPPFYEEYQIPFLLSYYLLSEFQSELLITLCCCFFVEPAMTHGMRLSKSRMWNGEKIFIANFTLAIKNFSEWFLTISMECVRLLLQKNKYNKFRLWRNFNHIGIWLHRLHIKKDL